MRSIQLTIAAVMTAAALAPAPAEGQETTIYACADRQGRLRTVQQPAECNDRETVVSWNVTGPQGSTGIRIVDSSAVPQQVGHWLGVMDGFARVGFHAVLPGGQALNMSLPIAPEGFIAGGEMYFPVNGPLLALAFQLCGLQPDFESCLLARFEQHVRDGDICQGDPYLPATATIPWSPTAFFDTTAIVGSAAELFRADTSVSPTQMGFPVGNGILLLVYDPDPADPVMRCTLDIRPPGSFPAYPATRVLSLYSVFTPPFRIRIDAVGQH
jgi:hypothetical protein